MQIWTPLPIGATGIDASIYWRSAGIPILNSSADFLSPLFRVLPIRQDITYWSCFTGAETEIHKIKDDSKINREKKIDRRSQRHIVNVWHLSDTPSFSLPTTFKDSDKGTMRSATKGGLPFEEFHDARKLTIKAMKKNCVKGRRD
jgi:hypothetical protein